MPTKSKKGKEIFFAESVEYGQVCKSKYNTKMIDAGKSFNWVYDVHIGIN